MSGRVCVGLDVATLDQGKLFVKRGFHRKIRVKVEAETWRVEKQTQSGSNPWLRRLVLIVNWVALKIPWKAASENTREMLCWGGGVTLKLPSMGWGPGLNKKEKTISLCLLTTAAGWSAALGYCFLVSVTVDETLELWAQINSSSLNCLVTAREKS